MSQKSYVPTSLMDAADKLRMYNRWRRGVDRDDDDMPNPADQPSPKELGVLIDYAADALESMSDTKSVAGDERINGLGRFIEDVESCYHMLMSDPDTKSALANAEYLLRAALADVKSRHGKSAFKEEGTNE